MDWLLTIILLTADGTSVGITEHTGVAGCHTAMVAAAEQLEEKYPDASWTLECKQKVESAPLPVWKKDDKPTIST